MAVTAGDLRELEEDVLKAAWAIQANALIPSDLQNLKARIETVRAVIDETPALKAQFTPINEQFIAVQSAALIEEKDEKEPAAKTVILTEARQYDMPGNQPSACTFHAIAAQTQIAQNFDLIYQQIMRGESRTLSQFQRGIVEAGLRDYNQQLARQPHLIQGADLEHIRLPEGLDLEQYRSENLEPFGDRLDRVMDHLSAPGDQTKVVWIKNGNEESFAVIAKANRFVIFDSHKNEIFAASSLEEARRKLVQKLSPFINPGPQGIDMTPFEFATGQIAVARRAAPQNRSCLRTICRAIYDHPVAAAATAAAIALSWMARSFL